MNTVRKIVYLHKRAGGLGVEEFHAALGQRLAAPAFEGLAGYVRSHTMPRGYANGELLFDAVEELTFAERGAADRFSGSDAEAGFLAQRRPLLDADASHRMAIDAHLVKSLDVPADAIRNIELVNRRPGMDLEPFRRYWREVHGPLAATIPSILRYEQYHLAPEAYGGEAPRYDGLAVTWFASTDAMRQGAATPEYGRTREDEGNFLPDGHLPVIIVRDAARA